MLLIIFIMFRASLDNPVIREAFATITPTPYENFPLYDLYETPFYSPTGDSAFVPVINFKDITTWRYNHFKELEPLPFLIDDDRLLFAGQLQEPDPLILDQFRLLNSELLCIDINSGEVLWQDWIGNPNLILDENHILYTPSTRDFVPAGLVAYDVVTGKKLWETRFPHDYGDIDTFYLIAPEIFVNVHLGHGTYSSYILNSETGEIKQSFENERRFEGNSGVVSGEIILERHYFGYGNVKAFSLAERNQLWELYKPVVSNIAIDNLTAFVVTMESQLLAVNINTGEILGSLQFSPAFDPNFDFFNPNYEKTFDYLNEAPTVAAGNNYVAIYFEDKKQLSVFHFTGGQ